MKNLRHFLTRLRTLIGLVAALIFFLTVLLPPVSGLITRQIIVKRVNSIPGTQLSEFHIRSLSAEATHIGWFSSEVHINATGTVLSADGQSSAERQGRLHINHGPIIWHLSDSLLALADIQLSPRVTDADTSEHFSGSAIVKLTPSMTVQLDAIAGIHASGGEHWVELRQNSPLLPFTGNHSQQLWLDLDIEALRAAGLGEHLARWQLTENARLSNNRLLFNIGPQ